MKLQQPIIITIIVIVIVIVIVIIITVIVTIIVRLRSDPDLTLMFSLIQTPEIIFGVDVGVIPQIFACKLGVLT